MVIPLRDENPTRRTPVVTIALIAVNLFVYFIIQMPKDSSPSDLIGNASEGTEFTFEYAAIPCEVTEGHPLTVAQFVTGECDAPPVSIDGATREVFPHKNVWLSVLFSMFLHGSILHVLGNMWFLWVFGNNVEDRLGPIGYLIFYLAAGFAAAAAHIAFNADSVVPVVGASGAIAGVMGAYLVWYPHARILSIVPIFLFMLLELKASTVLGIWFVVQFFTNPNEGVAWLAHVGGFLFGAAVAYALQGVLKPPPPVDYARPPRTRRRWFGAGGGDDDWDGGFRGGYPGRP